MILTTFCILAFLSLAACLVKILLVLQKISDRFDNLARENDAQAKARILTMITYGRIFYESFALLLFSSSVMLEDEARKSSQADKFEKARDINKVRQRMSEMISQFNETQAAAQKQTSNPQN